jgi:anthranilate synthase component 2/putative glutamine amidotransferase
VGSNGSSPPIIGLTTYVEPARHGAWDDVSALLPVAYVDAVVRAEGYPVLLPPSPTPPAVALAPLAGLVITGGPDVDPGRYGAAPHDQTDQPRRERDAWEIALCLAALDLGLPLLAICRGLQVLNVALGGTLHQHLPDAIGSDAHRPVPGQMVVNRMHLAAGSPIAAILGTETTGNCHHHQAIDQMAPGLRAVGFATEGIIEAVEVEGQEFALGVQWHPEDDATDDRLFAALVAAAASPRRVAP